MLNREDFLHVVRNAPLISMDLLVRNHDGGILVGLRRNRPAQGAWFVPGGIVRKDERFDVAFARITQAELGTAQRFGDARFIGPYEHFYADNFAGDPSFGTHYVVLAWLVDLTAALDLPREQHARYRWVSKDELAGDPTIHSNSRAYAAALS